MRAGLAVSILVVGPDGSPVVGATVGVSHPKPPGDPATDAGKGGFRSFATDATGVASVILDDATGPRALTVHPPVERRDVRSLERPEWTPQDETIALEPGHPVSGVLRDARGAAVRGFVHRKGTDGRFVPLAGTRSDGTFSTEGLAAGTVTLAGSRDVASPRGPERTVEAGSADVVLVVGE
jgi:hypothetical protein